MSARARLAEVEGFSGEGLLGDGPPREIRLREVSTGVGERAPKELRAEMPRWVTLADGAMPRRGERRGDRTPSWNAPPDLAVPSRGLDRLDMLELSASSLPMLWALESDLPVLEALASRLVLGALELGAADCSGPTTSVSLAVALGVPLGVPTVAPLLRWEIGVFRSLSRVTLLSTEASDTSLAELGVSILFFSGPSSEVRLVLGVCDLISSAECFVGAEVSCLFFHGQSIDTLCFVGVIGRFFGGVFGRGLCLVGVLGRFFGGVFGRGLVGVLGRGFGGVFGRAAGIAWSN